MSIDRSVFIESIVCEIMISKEWADQLLRNNIDKNDLLSIQLRVAALYTHTNLRVELVELGCVF